MPLDLLNFSIFKLFQFTNKNYDFNQRSPAGIFVLWRCIGDYLYLALIVTEVSTVVDTIADTSCCGETEKGNRCISDLG